MLSKRTPWQITLSVWYALFLREALARTTGDRMAWFWMLVEPIAFVVVMSSIRGISMGDHTINGADYIPWIVTGLMGFFLFRENLQRSLGAIQANKGLFAYRQVLPIDPVFVRCFLEGVIKTFILLLFVIAGTLMDIDLIADDPLMAFFAWISLWVLGLGAALTVSAASEIVPEVGHITRIAMIPLMIISGVFFPLNFLSHELLEYLLWNPIVHGLEVFRVSFFNDYRTMQGIEFSYLWLWNLSLITFGLMLHIRFGQRLKAQ